jgi:two-component system, cell cycle sensor histidine kinase and response regulator CckA
MLDGGRACGARRSGRGGMTAGGGLPPLIRGRGTILLAEDEEAVLRLERTVLELCGYEVLPARGAAEALQAAAGRAGPIDLLVTDVIMPGMNGWQLAEALRAERPGLRTLFVSGYPADVIAADGVIPEGIEFLQKPFPIASLAARVHLILFP